MGDLIVARAHTASQGGGEDCRGSRAPRHYGKWQTGAKGRGQTSVLFHRGIESLIHRAEWAGGEEERREGGRERERVERERRERGGGRESEREEVVERGGRW